MSAVAYTVAALLPDQETERRYLDWLCDGHVDAVVAAGARSGMIVRVREPSHPIKVETRYIFATREDLQRYLDHHAPAFRAEGLARFPPGSGVRFERTIGDVV